MHTLITEIRDKQNITKEQLQLLLETDNQEMIEEATDQLCRDCGKLHFIPCTTHGLNFSCIPGVYEAVDQEIDKMTKEMF